MSDEAEGSLLALLTQGQVETARGFTSRGATVPLSVAGFDDSGVLVSAVTPTSPTTHPGAKVGLLLAAHEVNAWSAMWTVARTTVPTDPTVNEGLAVITWTVDTEGANEIKAWAADGTSLGVLGTASEIPDSMLGESADALSMSAAWARARSGNVPEIGVVRDALTVGLRQEGVHITVRARPGAESPEKVGS